MRTSIAVLGLLALLVPAVATAQDAPPPTMPPGTVPPPAPTPETAPPPPTPPPPPPMATAPAAPTMVAAEPPGHASMKGISVWGILPWNGYGAGARFMIPLSIQPLLRSSGLRDNFALELGADFLHWSYGILGNNYGWTEVLPVGGLMWSIWLNQQFALYPKAEFGYAFGWYTGWQDAWGPRPTYGGLFWDVAGGLLYKLDNGITLRAEAGYAGLKLGAGFLF